MITDFFQILTQEDWNYVLYLAMRYTSHWAAIYFIALMTFGNYVLFNLLVAILVEGFADEEEERQSSKLSNSPKKKLKVPEFGARQVEQETEDETQLADEAVLEIHETALESTGNGPLLAVPLIMRTAATPISIFELNRVVTEDQLLRVPFRNPLHSGSLETLQGSPVRPLLSRIPDRKPSLAEEER